MPLDVVVIIASVLVAALAAAWTFRRRTDVPEGPSDIEARWKSYKEGADLRQAARQAARHARVRSDLRERSTPAGSTEADSEGTRVFRGGGPGSEAPSGERRRAEGWEDIRVIVRRNRVTALYHFTDSENIASINKHGGLCSWRYCETNGIVIPRPGGNHLSRTLDARKGLGDYVRLSFVRDTPMRYVAKMDGRLRREVMLEVDPEVMYWEGTLFSDRNATANSVRVGPGAAGLEFVRFDVLRKRRWAGEEEKQLKQAEVLVHQRIPSQFIRNLPGQTHGH